MQNADFGIHILFYQTRVQNECPNNHLQMQKKIVKSNLHIVIEHSLILHFRSIFQRQIHERFAAY